MKHEPVVHDPGSFLVSTGKGKYAREKHASTTVITLLVTGTVMMLCGVPIMVHVMMLGNLATSVETNPAMIVIIPSPPFPPSWAWIGLVASVIGVAVLAIWRRMERRIVLMLVIFAIVRAFWWECMELAINSTSILIYSPGDPWVYRFFVDTTMITTVGIEAIFGAWASSAGLLFVVVAVSIVSFHVERKRKMLDKNGVETATFTVSRDVDCKIIDGKKLCRVSGISSFAK